MTKPEEMPREIWVDEGYAHAHDHDWGAVKYIRADLATRAHPQPAGEIFSPVSSCELAKALGKSEEEAETFERGLNAVIRREDIKINNQAAKAAPSVVTVEEFANKMLDSVILNGQLSMCYARAIAEHYPNGIKIVREK